MNRVVFWILLMVVAGGVSARLTINYVHWSKHRSPAGTSRKDREQAIDYLDSLYNRYLKEDVKGARAALIEACVYMKKSPIPESKGGLVLGYARLSVLEERAGNPKEAEMYYQRAKRCLKSNPDAFTREECRTIVTHWDETYTKKAGPRYMQLLNEAQKKETVK
jgi:hypothetical protein